MEGKERIARSLRAGALAGALASVFARGLWVALELERDLFASTGAAIEGESRPAMYRFEDGGVGFRITTTCGFEPQFEPLALIVVPLTLWMTLPGPRPVERRLNA